VLARIIFDEPSLCRPAEEYFHRHSCVEALGRSAHEAVENSRNVAGRYLPEWSPFEPGQKMSAQQPRILFGSAGLVALFGHSEERSKRILERGCLYLVNAEREFRDQTLCLGARIGEGKRRIPTDRMTLAIVAIDQDEGPAAALRDPNAEARDGIIPVGRLSRSGHR
jgi:hypothetical protein